MVVRLDVNGFGTRKSKIKDFELPLRVGEEKR